MSIVTLERLTDPGDERFSALLRIYEAAIPARERKSEEAVRAMAARSSHCVIAALLERIPVGFYAVYDGGIALLEYLAVDEATRGRGIGARLYEAARDAVTGRPLLIEVESDRENTPERQARARRIAFYRRLGCRRIGDIEFIMPLAGSGPPPKLDLLIDAYAPASVPAAELGAWLSEIYEAVYGCRRGDPRLAYMLANLPAEVPFD